MDKRAYLQRKVHPLKLRLQATPHLFSKLLFALFLSIVFAFFTALFGSYFILKGVSQLLEKTSLTQRGSNGVQTYQVLLSWEEIKKHNNIQDCWIVIRGRVYDVTSYIYFHPGGGEAIKSVCGSDATLVFETKGGGSSHSQKAWSILDSYLIGQIGETVQYDPQNYSFSPQGIQDAWRLIKNIIKGESGEGRGEEKEGWEDD